MQYLRITSLGFSTLCIVVALVALKYALFILGLEFLTMNSLYTSAISGAVFIMGFLLAGVFADYKEAERAPAELHSTLESIWEDALACKKAHASFDLERVRTLLQECVRSIFAGLAHDSKHNELHGATDALARLSDSFAEMEQAGVPANHVVRLKSERANARRVLLRIEHMQRTQFVPSVYFLAESIAFSVVALVLFLKSDGAPEFLVLFAFISYLFLYVLRLIPLLEQPFRQGHNTKDDVSLFLLHEFEEKLAQNTPAL